MLRSDVNISFGTAAKLAKALEMDFFPELGEKVGVDKSGQTEIDSIADQVTAAVRK